jgi:predicted dehydrogenase
MSRPVDRSKTTRPAHSLTRHSSRRDFLKRSALAGALASGYFTSRAAAESRSANEKLNIGTIGTANQARFSMNGVTSENLVAICDVDDHFLDKAAQDYPRAQKYNDFRKLLEQKDLDAVIIAPPDHIHALATVRALRLGKHVYCEKPLTHTVAEARLVADEAAKAKVATQMGTQIHAGDNYRRVVEIIRSGAIGRVTEAHVWANRACTVATGLPAGTPAPDWMHWDLWLGPAPERAYSSEYAPFTWRRWWDYSNGAMGDMACHRIDLAFWALDLRYPSSVMTDGPTVDPDCCPAGLVSHYEFPARDEQPAVKLTWYDGDRIPQAIHDAPCGNGGNLFVGDRGMLWADYDKYRLLPEDKFTGYTPPAPTIPSSIGHHAEWIAACKTGSPTTCNFDYAGALTEAVLLGVAAYRAGQKIEWDPVALKAKGAGGAALEPLLHKQYRAGWEIV